MNTTRSSSPAGRASATGNAAHAYVRAAGALRPFPSQPVLWYELIGQALAFSGAAGWGLFSVWGHVHRGEYDQARSRLDEVLAAHPAAAAPAPARWAGAGSDTRLGGGEVSQAVSPAVSTALNDLLLCVSGCALASDAQSPLTPRGGVR